jgi:hypothetical protein
LFELPEDSSAVSLWRRTGEESVGCLTYVLVDLADDQDPHVENHAIGAHAGPVLGGISGRYPDGSSWLVLIAAGGDPSATVRRINPMAAVRSLAVDLEQARDYVPTVPDLDAFALVTLLESLGLDRWRCAQALEDGCGFPGREHECAHDGFNDICNAWVSGRLWELLGEE